VSSLYVHALTDRPTPAWTTHGRRIQSVAVGNIFAVGERRARAPQLSEEELRFQHGIVVAIAARVPAVLPARFGSLIDDKALEAIVLQSESTIDEAMTLVRDRIQMTLRAAPKLKGNMATTASSVKRRDAHLSGKQYLELRSKRASTTLPPGLESVIARTSGYVAAEHRQATPAGTVVVYQLVNRTDVDEYRRALGAARGLTVSGPWPPFAFVPELWS